MRCIAGFVVLIVAAVAFGQVETDQQVFDSARPEAARATIQMRGSAIQIDAVSGEVLLNVQSSPVLWNGGEYHLAQFGMVELELADDHRLTATLHCGLLMFDDVMCTLHLAVFDEAGTLLGTAQATEHIDRVWLGVPLLMFRTVQLDFGMCACYSDVQFISGTATHGDVQTPDAWQK